MSERNFAEFQAMLHDEPAAVHERFSFDQSTLLHQAMTNYTPHEFADLLLKAGADVNAADASGETPLHYWMKAHHSGDEALELLLDAGGDLSIPDKAGRTPLDYAKGRSDYGQLAPLLARQRKRSL